MAETVVSNKQHLKTNTNTQIQKYTHTQIHPYSRTHTHAYRTSALIKQGGVVAIVFILAVLRMIPDFLRSTNDEKNKM